CGMTEEESQAATERPPEPSPPAEPVPEIPAEPDWATSYKYLLAEFDNYRKRVERERDQRGRDARALLLRDLLPLYEGLSKASESIRSLPSTDPLRRGLELLHKEWERFLDKEEVAAVARVGELFRPEVMEAMGETPTTTPKADGTVAEVVLQGYLVGTRLLRPARVIVAKRVEAKEQVDEEPRVGFDGEGP
ncbi:MAG: nucleotide exchange factor GrpE, partial [Thermoplasmata archaeon]|nr:nucleotide exchange factor GrpE [Thermoplasmata archaeon]